MTPEPSRQALDVPRPKSSSRVSVNFEEGHSEDGHRQFRLALSQCVETKTVTTTTRLTRQFPQVLVRDPTPLHRLNVKDYPLAAKSTPRELIEFSYLVPGSEHVYEHIRQEENRRPLPKHKQVVTGKRTPALPQAETSLSEQDSPSPTLDTRPELRSPSAAYPRRPRPQHGVRRESSPPDALSTSTSVNISRPQPRSLRSSQLHAVSDKLRRSIARSSTSNLFAGRDESPAHSFGAVGCLATPDATELVGGSSSRPSRAAPSSMAPHHDSPDPTPRSVQDQPTCPHNNEDNSTENEPHTISTPPITDADQEPFSQPEDSPLQPNRTFPSRPSIDTVAAQDASLPSPRLSPTLAATQLQTQSQAERDANPFARLNHRNEPLGWLRDSQQALDEEYDTSADLSYFPSGADAVARSPRYPSQMDESALRLDTQSLLNTFDSMKTEMKTFMMYQFLRRCPRPTLRVVANAVNPALMCNFLDQLPLELGYYVLSYLGHRDLCRAAQVSKQWRNIVDRNETGWKELFDAEGFKLGPGELSKAVQQGWGWQDPVGVMGFEKDLSMLNRLTSSETDLLRSVRQDPAPRTRGSKRKRGLNAYSAAERSKRRASGAELGPVGRDYKARQETRQHKSAGPLSAASAAAAAVPDPQLGLDSLRQLHLFKSLYRRHHMIRQSWTSGEVKPGHVAFAAHPRHVITCLQFDDDKIITGSDDQLIHIYDTKTGKLRKKLEGHEGGVWALQYEGNMLVSGSTDRSVRVWDIERGLCQQVFYGHTSTVRCLQILMPTEMGKDTSGRTIMQPEKPLIITGSRDSQLRVWRLPEVGSRRYIQTGPPAQESDCPYFIRVLTGHTHSVRAISAHGDTLVSGSYDSTVRVWKISTGEVQHVLHGHSQKVYSVVLDHERNRCISGSMDSLVKIWDLNTGACIHTLEGHSLLVGLLDLRDERLVSAAADSTLRIWDPESGKCRNTLMAHTGAITCFQHDGRKVISGSEKTVKMWDVKTGECIQDLLTDLTGVWQVKFDERRCVAAVQRDQLTYVEILDFGAVRDGMPPETLGKRILLNEPEVRAIIEDEV